MSRGCCAVRKNSEVRFFGGYNAIHGGLEFARGGRVKLPVLVGWFGNNLLGWNFLYLVSSALPAKQLTACGGMLLLGHLTLRRVLTGRDQIM